MNIRKELPDVPFDKLDSMSTEELIQIGIKVCDRLKKKTDLKSRRLHFAVRHSLRSGLPDIDKMSLFAMESISK